MNLAAKAARTGDKVLSFLAIILMLLMLSYGGYSLWDTYVTMSGAFTDRNFLKYKPNVENKEETRLSLEELLAINPDTRAWISVDGTHIDYPLVQGRDDMEYVNKSVTGEFALAGSIFLSAYNDSSLSDPYLLTYGHHMENGGMYGDVMEFLKEDYFNKHQSGHLFFPDGSAKKLDVFAVIECDAYDRMIYQVDGRNFGTMKLLEYLNEKSTHIRDIGIKEGDQVIALSTCVSIETNGRAVVMARVNP